MRFADQWNSTVGYLTAVRCMGIYTHTRVRDPLIPCNQSAAGTAYMYEQLVLRLMEPQR